MEKIINSGYKKVATWDESATLKGDCFFAVCTHKATTGSAPFTFTIVTPAATDKLVYITDLYIGGPLSIDNIAIKSGSFTFTSAGSASVTTRSVVGTGGVLEGMTVYNTNHNAYKQTALKFYTGSAFIADGTVITASTTNTALPAWQPAFTASYDTVWALATNSQSMVLYATSSKVYDPGTLVLKPATNYEIKVTPVSVDAEEVDVAMQWIEKPVVE